MKMDDKLKGEEQQVEGEGRDVNVITNNIYQ